MSHKRYKAEDKISFVVDEASANKLNQLLDARGLSVSETMRICIEETKILQIGNVTDFAVEFCKIRTAIESGNVDEELHKEVNAICQYMSDFLHQMEA